MFLTERYLAYSRRTMLFKRCIVAILCAL